MKVIIDFDVPDIYAEDNNYALGRKSVINIVDYLKDNIDLTDWAITGIQIVE